MATARGFPIQTSFLYPSYLGKNECLKIFISRNVASIAIKDTIRNISLKQANKFSLGLEYQKS